MFDQGMLMSRKLAAAVDERQWPPRERSAVPGNVGQSIGRLVLSVVLAALPAMACSAADGAAETDAAEGSQPAVVVANRVCTDECSMYLREHRARRAHE